MLLSSTFSQRLTQVCLSLVAFTFVLIPVTPSLAKSPITLEACQQMAPVTMAEKSEYIMNSYNYLLKATNEISDLTLRKQVSEYLKNPIPTVMKQFPTDSEKEVLKQQLVTAGYIKSDTTYNQILPPIQDTTKAPQPFYAAPGSVYMGHHSYPGGLATHVAVVTKSALGIYNAYKETYGIEMNKDVIIASTMMHDMNKPWVFQWQKDGASFPEYTIAGTGAHHILSIAEAMYRDFPKEVIVAMACAHTPPSNPQDEQQVVAWLKAAAIIAGKNPIEIGVLDPQGNSLPQPRWMEGFITHLGDHDYILTGPMAGWLITKLGDIAKTEYNMSDSDLKSSKFYTFRNYIFSQITVERLYNIWVTGGDKALLSTVTSLVTK